MSDPTREMNIPQMHVDQLQPLEGDPDATPLAPHDPHHINPKLTSDIRYWAAQFGVSGQLLHEAIRVHGNSVDKVRAALAEGRVSLT